MLKGKLMTVILALVVCLGISPGAFTCANCFAESADASQGLSVTYTAQPVSMVVPQEMLVRLTLIFSDTRSLGNIRLSREDGTVIANVNKDNITSGAPYVLSDTMIPTEKQLSGGVVLYTVRYTEDFGLPSATELEKEVEIRLEKLPAVPGIEFTRLAPYTLVSRGADTSIIYKVYNTGNVAITNLFVSDIMVGEVARVDRLEPGERMSFVKSANIVENAISIPKIVYSHAATSDSFSTELAPTAITVAREDLRLVLSADNDEIAESGMVKLACAVSNRGDVAYGDITIYDDTLGRVIFPAAEILPGEEYNFSKTVCVSGDTDFKYTLSALCETGRNVSVSSNTVSLSVGKGAYESVDIDLKAKVISVGEGDVKVELRLNNHADAGIKNVRLSERSRGIFKTLFIAPPGETVLTRTFGASVGDELAFMAEVTDINGGMLTILSNEVSADGNTPREMPNASDEAVQLDKMDGVSLKIPDVYNTYTNMILIASLVLALLIIIAVISMMRRKRQQIRREEERAKNVRRALMRAGKGQEEGDIDSGDITLAVYGELRKEKKGDLLSEKDRKPGSI